MTIFGYASASGNEPLEGQRLALQRAGALQIFEDASPENDQRPGLEEAINSASEGDALFVTALCALGGSASDMQDIWGRLASKNVGLKTINHPAFDTRALEFGTLLATLSALSGLESDLRRARRQELVKVKVGRQSGLTPAAIAKQAGIAVPRVYAALGWLASPDALTLDDICDGVSPCQVFKSIADFDPDISNHEIASDFTDRFERCDSVTRQHIWYWGARRGERGGYTDQELDAILIGELQRAGYLTQA